MKNETIRITVGTSLKYLTDLNCSFGSTYTVEVGDAEGYSVQVDKRITPMSVNVFIEDASIAQFLDAEAQYSLDSNGGKYFNGYFDLHIKGLRAGSTKAVVYTYVDGATWQRAEFTIKVVPAGSIPQTCPLCDGKKICPYCFGQGYTRNPLDATEKWPCVTCGGTGVCPVCHGTGKPTG